MNDLITLYLKETDKGLKYLGKTIRDPYKYKGSGLLWVRHIKKYNLTNDNIKTTILFQTRDKSEFKEVALYYSKLYDIVNSKEFANLTEEYGQGGKTISKETHPNHPAFSFEKRMNEFWSNEENRKNFSIRMKKNNPMSDKKNRDKISKANKGKKRTIEQREKMGVYGENNPAKKLENRKKISKALMGHSVSDETRRKISETLKKRNKLKRKNKQ